jgi:hypothetical protein
MALALTCVIQDPVSGVVQLKKEGKKEGNVIFIENEEDSELQPWWNGVRERHKLRCNKKVKEWGRRRATTAMLSAQRFVWRWWDYHTIQTGSNM